MKPVSSLIWLLILSTLAACKTSYTSITKSPSDAIKVSFPVSKGINNNFKDFAKLGYQKGESAPNFTLFSLDGTEFTLATALKTSKAVVLISGSYTCDMSRLNLVDVNALTAKYRNKLNIYVVYTIDAHPLDVASPYSTRNQIELASANTRDHIEAKQPKTYGERKKLARQWQQQNAILAPVLVDKPTNDFWLSFGQAPNMAYLITPDRRVYYRQTWFKYTDFDAVIKQWLRGSSEKLIE